MLLLQLGQRQIKAGDRNAATATYLRVGELLWQAPPLARTTFEPLEAALEKTTWPPPRCRPPGSKRAQGQPDVPREPARAQNRHPGHSAAPQLQGEPPARAFGELLQISFVAHPLDPAPAGGRALAAGDFDQDGKPDLAWIKASGELEFRLAAKRLGRRRQTPAADLWDLEGLDLDNDGKLDLFAYGAKRRRLPARPGRRRLHRRHRRAGSRQRRRPRAVAFDYDIEGDLDLALAGAGAGPIELWRNNLEGPPRKVGRQRPRHRGPPSRVEAEALVASDLDRDGDLDLLLGNGQGLTWLDNQRQGRFTDRTEGGGLANLPFPANWGPEAAAVAAVAAADFDNDGRPDIAYASGGTWSASPATSAADSGPGGARQRPPGWRSERRSRWRPRTPTTTAGSTSWQPASTG